jgi:hypothetical protein
LRFDLIFKLDHCGNTAFAKPNLTLQDQQQSDQEGWPKTVFHEH